MAEHRIIPINSELLGNENAKHYDGSMIEWSADEVFITLRGQFHYLWRAVDQDGDVIDILVQRRRMETGDLRLTHPPVR